MSPTIVLLAASILGLGPGPDKADPNLDKMKATAASYRFARDGDSAPLRLQADPAFRMGKQPADNVLEGAIFFWLGEDDRPEAAAQIFEIVDSRDKSGLWIHEFISLSPTGFAGDRNGRPSWSPRIPGVDFQAVPNAPKPAEAAAQRTGQMKALAREFGASDFFNDKRWVELRLLPTPIARYGKAGGTVQDGGLFAFVTGTDPEAFLFLEVRAGKNGPEWQYAFAPMTCYRLKGSHAGKPVWDIPYRPDSVSNDPAKPYYHDTD